MNRRPTLSFLSLSLALVALPATVACSDDGTDGDSPLLDDDTGTIDDASTVRGAVSDDAGTQQLTADASAAVRVEAWLATPGEEDLIGQAEVSGEGTYEMEVAADMEDVRILALDSDDEIVGSVLLMSTPPEGETMTVAPITSETSVETEVWVQASVEAVEEGHTADAVSMAEVMARIDADVGAAVAAYEEQTGEASPAVQALAEATLAVQGAQLAWADAEGTVLSHAEHDDALEAATAELYAELYADARGDGDAAAAHAAWMDAWAGSWLEQGVTLRDRAELESLAGLTSRGVLVMSLGDDGASNGVIEAWLLATGEREAVRVAASSEAVVTDAFDAGIELVDLVVDASTELESSASSAGDVVAMQSAFDSYAEAMVGVGLVEDSAIAAMLGLSSAFDGESLLTACDDAAAEMESEFMTYLETQPGGDVDADLTGGAALAAWTDYAVDVETEVIGTGSTASEDELSAATWVMLEASGAFRGTYPALW